MSELKLKGIEYFRKGSTLRKINEDPTLLSFMLIFNTVSVADSPLLATGRGSALDYLENVINLGADNDGKGPGVKYAESLKNFQKLLIKINKEMPWYWQSLSGLETTQQFNKMEDPFWGKDRKITIECLEENVELMGMTLMKQYRDACYDFTRWVEIIPENLRRFQVDIFVTEVRDFQQKTSSRMLDSFGNLPKGSIDSEGDNTIAGEMAASAKPFFQIKLGHCIWDIDSGNEMIADLSVNPEMKKPKLNFFYRTVETPNYRWGANLGSSENTLIIPKEDPTVDAYNPKSPILGAAKSKFAKLKDKAVGGKIAQVKNLAQGVTGGPGLGNANGKILGGAAAGLLDRATESIGAMFLDNVYGVNTSSTIADAITTGSINGLLNAAKQITASSSTKKSGKELIGLPNVYDGPAIDSSPDGKISPKQIYDPRPADRDDPINDNVYE